MATLPIALAAEIFYFIAYHTYGEWLAGKIFKLDPASVAPSIALNDDQDYVPTDKAIVFGHHFASIAGKCGQRGMILWPLFGATTNCSEVSHF
jgi:carbon starvation protein